MGFKTGRRHREKLACMMAICLVLALTTAPALAQRNYDAEIAGYVRDLSSKNLNVRDNAANSLGNEANNPEFGRAAAVAVPALLQALKDRDPTLRGAAAFALGSIGAQPEKTVPALIEALKDPENRVRQSAADALGEFHSESSSAVPALAAALADPDDQVRQTAAKSLISFGSEAQRSLPAFIDILQKPGAKDRYLAAEVIAGIGPAAQPAVPALTAALKDQDISVRLDSARALGAIGANLAQAFPVASRLLVNEDWHIRARAAFVVGTLGAVAAPAIPTLIKRLRDDEPVNKIAAQALANIAVSLKEAHRTDAIKALEDAQAAIGQSDDSDIESKTPDLDDAISALKAPTDRAQK